MAEEEGLSEVNPPSPPPFLEVSCNNLKKSTRFAVGTKAGFAVSLINRKLETGSPLVLHIEAVKDGEEPISFGPDAVLVDYGSGWKLQTVCQSDYGGGRRPEPVEIDPAGIPKASSSSDGSEPANIVPKSTDTVFYIAKILLAFILIFVLGAAFTLALENLPRMILFVNSFMIEATMAALKSFVEVQPDSHFPIQNLPYGVFKPSPSSAPRPGVAIGDFVLDLSEIARAGLFDTPVLKDSDCFLQPDLNKFLSLGKPAWNEARATLQKILSAIEPVLRDNASLRQKSLVPMSVVEMVLPVVIGDYTDFFSSMHHAKNCGVIFRGPQNPINPNWFHLPIAYHGRASSIVVSGTDIVRPRGQGHPTGNSPPYFGPSLKLDFELEMAAVVGPGNELGKPVDVNEAKDHIFGLVLMNDWSARDIQAWEYVPLGPFLGKSFGTTMSPWIVTLDALEPFSCDAPKQDPPPLPYLSETISKNYDISLEVHIKPAGQENSFILTRSNFKHLYWTLTQQLAHHTINGCNLRPGDLLGTGTISGPEPESMGCLLELTWNGQKPLSVNGLTRKFLEDGDEVTLIGFSKGDGYNVGFGTCTGKILAALQ